MNKNAELLLPLAIAHEKADEYVKGTYSKDGPTFRGCSVGCSINDATRLGLLTSKTADYHAELARVLFNGVEQIARLQDVVFEGLPKYLAPEWTPRLLKAVIDAPENINYQHVWHLFAHWLLVDPDHGVIRYIEDKEVVQRVADLHLLATTEVVGDNQWKDARDAAASDASASDTVASDAVASDAVASDAVASDAVASDAVAEAARAAVWAKRAATKAAEVAAWNAGDAAESAAWAAEDDARAVVYEKMADKFIELISGK